MSIMNQMQIFPIPNFFLFPSKSLPLLLYHLLSSLSTFFPPLSLTSQYIIYPYTHHTRNIFAKVTKNLCLFTQWEFLNLYFLWPQNIWHLYQHSSLVVVLSLDEILHFFVGSLPLIRIFILVPTSSNPIHFYFIGTSIPMFPFPTYSYALSIL